MEIDRWAPNILSGVRAAAAGGGAVGTSSASCVARIERSKIRERSIRGQSPGFRLCYAG